MFRRRARRIAELEQVVARVLRRLNEVDERLASIADVEHEKARRQVEELRAEAEQILRDRAAEKLRHEKELAHRKTAHAIALAHARAAVEAELDDVRTQIAEARQELRLTEQDDEVARPESLRPIGADEAFTPLPRAEERRTDVRLPLGDGRRLAREDQAAP
ncbi:hypothetical protein ACFFQW_35565 [Umezawaea endophytica]|uniref:Uncharacterized protein n=1 Tax=Umezawaea endophytica TaxID=1654476 RepID=A0A9X2VWW9_9PSEU|nr:hypothetical protein [Umezawaea endophytica]MCS7483173.1 hypothetical protein [Umezawaea endophytica]